MPPHTTHKGHTLVPAPCNTCPDAQTCMGCEAVDDWVKGRDDSEGTEVWSRDTEKVWYYENLRGRNHGTNA